jgi:hypothetical protein
LWAAEAGAKAGDGYLSKPKARKKSALNSTMWGRIILDEGHQIKNHKRYKYYKHSYASELHTVYSLQCNAHGWLCGTGNVMWSMPCAARQRRRCLRSRRIGGGS